MAFEVSDGLLGTFVPIAVYWLYSGLYIVLDGLGMDDYRLHPKGDEETKNIVSKWTVFKGVLVQQAFQIAVSTLLFTVITFTASNYQEKLVSFGTELVKCFISI